MLVDVARRRLRDWPKPAISSMGESVSGTRATKSWTSLQRCQTHAGRRLAASASRLGCLCTPLRKVLGDTSDVATRSTIVFKPAALRQAVQQLLVWCTGIGALCFRPGSRSWKCPHLRAHRCALHCLRKQSRRGGGGPTGGAQKVSAVAVWPWTK